MTGAPVTAPAHPAGPSEVDAAAIATAELEQLRAAAARYVFLRTRFLRRPVNVNAWGQPSYGVTVKAPHDLTAHDFDRAHRARGPGAAAATAQARAPPPEALQEAEDRQSAPRDRQAGWPVSPSTRFTNAYPADWPLISQIAKVLAGYRCVRCLHPFNPGGRPECCDSRCDPSRGFHPARGLVTPYHIELLDGINYGVHHLDGDKGTRCGGTSCRSATRAT
jgi:hypothetical protein